MTTRSTVFSINVMRDERLAHFVHCPLSFNILVLTISFKVLQWMNEQVAFVAYTLSALLVVV